MHKKVFALLLSCASICVLTSCWQGVYESENRLSSDRMCTYSSKTENGKVGEEMSRHKLLVNGNELSNCQSAMIDSKTRNAEVPLLAVLRSLGADVTWEHNGYITVEHAGKTAMLDSQKNDFGVPVPPGTTGAVRRKYDGEIVIDVVSIKGLLFNLMGAEVSIDYDALIIYVNSVNN